MWEAVFCAGPEQLCLIRVELQAVCGHPVADVGDAEFEPCGSWSRVAAIAMYIQLRIVGIRMEVNTMSVDFVGKVANVQNEQSRPKLWSLWDQTKNDNCACVVTAMRFVILLIFTEMNESMNWNAFTTNFLSFCLLSYLAYLPFLVMPSAVVDPRYTKYYNTVHCRHPFQSCVVWCRPVLLSDITRRCTSVSTTV